MSLTRVTAAKSTTEDLNQIIDHLEGVSGKTLAWLLRVAAANNFIVQLADDAGDTSFLVKDSAGGTIMTLTSTGNLTVSGNISLSTLLMPSAASPANTALGDVVLDSDDLRVTVGDGTSRRNLSFFDKGTNLTAAATLTLTAGYSYFQVDGTTGITALSSRPAGEVVRLTFTGRALLTHNATSLILLGGNSHYTDAGEVLTFVSEGSGNWRQVSTSFDVWQQARAASEVNADTGYWKTLLELSHIPLVATDAIAATEAAVGGGFTQMSNGGGGSGNTFTIPTTVNDLTKGMTKIATGTTATNEMGLFAWLGIDVNTDDFDVSCVIALDNNASRSVFFGFKANRTAADENNILAFRVTNNGNIIGVADSAGVETTRDSGSAGAAAPGTRYVLRITGSAGTVKFFVNNAQVGADVTTNLPAAGTAPYLVLGVRTSAGASAELHARNLFARMRAN